MGNVVDVSAVMRLFARGSTHPVAIRRYRSVLATEHVVETGDTWEWGRQPHGSEAIAALVFAESPLRIVSELGESVLSAGEVAFMHPHRQTTIESLRSSSGISVCVPWEALREVEDGVQPPGQIISATPLTAGLMAFVTALLNQQETPTVYTDYLVERAIVEMSFGMLLESAPKSVVGTRDVRVIDRARSLMLLHRADPDFGVAALATHLHMSTRHVQRLFAAEGSSPADELRGMRLDLAREMLGDSDYDTLSVGEIAAHAGFGTAAAMRRAFVAREMPLPSRVRRNQTSVA